MVEAEHAQPARLEVLRERLSELVDEPLDQRQPFRAPGQIMAR